MKDCADKKNEIKWASWLKIIHCVALRTRDPGAHSNQASMSTLCVFYVK